MPDREDSLTTLVERAQAGDLDAFGTLFDRLNPPLHRYLLWRLRHDADADDATQVTWMRAWDALGSYTEQGAGFRAWLFAIGRNVATDHERAAARRPIPGEIPDAAAPAAYQPEMVAETADRNAMLRAAMHQLLTPLQRDVLLLRVVGGFDTAETGTLTGRPPGAVRALQFRALHTLRRDLLTAMEVPLAAS